MFSSTFFVSILLCALSVANALPVVELSKRQSITALSTSQITSYRPYTHFASTAYCKPSVTVNWSCGANCAANADFIPTASGGDGTSVQYWFVGWSPSLASVIVAHQGTDPTSAAADATDIKAILTNLDSGLFPGISSSVKTHSGFTSEHAKTATAILSAVQSTISARKATKVTVVGHSLGAALALLDGVYLPLHISGVSFRVVGYGMPRVGNQDFANYIDSHLSGAVTHINNKEDLVPTVPGMFLGYHHPSGEIHITDNGQWMNCPGQDNSSTQCVVGDVPTVLSGNTSDHDGPYDSISMDC